MNVDILTQNFFCPSDQVQAFSEEDDEGENELIESWICLKGDLVEVECKSLVDKHLASRFFINIQVGIIIVSPTSSNPCLAIIL